MLCATLLPAGKALAQGGGVLGGFTYAKINVSGSESLNAAFREKWEPALGGFISFDVRDQLSIDVEAMWSVQGSRLTSGAIRENIDLTYINVPVLVRWAPPPDSTMPWLRIFGGPYTAFLLDAESKNRDTDQTRDLDDAFESLDFGWVAGFGVHAVGLDFDIRYGGSFVNIADQKDLNLGLDGNLERVKYRNRLFTFLVRYGF